MIRILLLLLAAFTASAHAADDGLHPDPYLVLDPGRHTAPIWWVDTDREGRYLVTASDDKTVRVWAAADGRLLRTLRLPAGPGNVGKAYAAAISPDGTIVAAGGWTSTTGTNEDIYLFDRASGRMLRRVGRLPMRVQKSPFHLMVVGSLLRSGLDGQLVA